MGAGPQRRIPQRRVERAKVLLRRGNSALASIAAFKRETGITPGQFRAAAG